MDGFRLFTETSLAELFDSAVAAFPNTKKRQHVMDEVRVENIRATALTARHNLLVAATAVNEDRTYPVTILFRNVRFHQPGVRLTDTSGTRLSLEQLDVTQTPVQVRCACPDFGWRFRHWNHHGGTLFGPPGGIYVGSGRGAVNPMQREGLCKHVMVLMDELINRGWVG